MVLTRRGSLLRATPLLLAVVLVLGACTDDAPTPPEPPAPTETTASPPPVPQAAPLEVRIVGVAGRLPRPARKVATRRVSDTVGDYLDGAFLGEFPRTTYAGAWTHFTPAAKRRARNDLGVLTHADRGARIASVVPLQQQVRVHALAPRRKLLGATARVRLVLRVAHADGTVQRVRIAGRLLLTRAPDRSFRIFGYDLRRASGPVRTPGGGA